MTAPHYCLGLVVAVSILAFGAQRSAAFPTFQTLIPNGNSVPNPCAPSQIWPGVGHLDPAGRRKLLGQRGHSSFV